MSATLDVGCRRLLRCLVVSCACLGVAGCASGAPRRTSRLAVPMPAVAGPIPSTSSNFPFIADGFGPEPRVPSGYEENEYFVSGRAKLYEYSATGVRVIAPCPASAGRLGCRNLPYTTRMLVKRPIDPRRFSGTVIIEPFNPSSGYDIANVWDRSWPYFVEQGDVFVGWTSRYESIRALKRFAPQRYVRLAWGENSAVDDGITFDIAAQIGALFKLNGPPQPAPSPHGAPRFRVRFLAGRRLHVHAGGRVQRDRPFAQRRARVRRLRARRYGRSKRHQFRPDGRGITPVGRSAEPDGSHATHLSSRSTPRPRRFSSAVRRHWHTADPTAMPATIDTGCGRCRVPATSPMISADRRSPRNETWRKSSGSR